MKIVIAGFGIEGRSNYEYFKREFPDAEMVIADEKDIDEVPPSDATVISGEGVFSRLDDADLVVRTASLSPGKIKTHGKIWSATNEFFDKCPAPIIGVTGTKGKGTTCSLIASILRKAGKNVHLVGNIGTPALDVLPSIVASDVVVYELSSFQLWDIEKSPKIAVMLMIEPDHLDVHQDFEDYLSAKMNIAKYQDSSDTVIYHPKNKDSAAIAKQGRGEKIRYATEDAVYVEDDYFMWHGERLCEVSALQLPGRHNIDNACAAISAVKIFDSNVKNDDIEAGLRSFQGLPHRLRFVAEKSGVKYFDDSIATTPGSAIAAIRAFDSPKILILGGYDKGASYAELAKEIAGTNVKALVLIGANAEKIAATLQEADALAEVRLVGQKPMDEIVAVANSLAEYGNVVIMSPAAASFDMFKSYSDRGDQFIAAVEGLE